MNTSEAFSHLGRIVWRRNKTNDKCLDAKNRDRSTHAYLKDAYKATRIWYNQLLNLLIILLGCMLMIPLFWSPFGTWQTVQSALEHQTGVFVHICVAYASFSICFIGLHGFRKIGTFGPVSSFLALEFVKIRWLMGKGLIFIPSLKFLNGLTHSVFENIDDLYEEWTKYLYHSLVEFAREIRNDEKKNSGMSRGFLEHAFKNQLKVAEYFGLGDSRKLRKEVYGVAAGTSPPRFLPES
ncbi:MAG: hypothetical protein FGM57_03500 [Candidatus Taylorbacteria bacterium]|nr:hypothetical protein [Candidatus Taylorbacteria bacterium]